MHDGQMELEAGMLRSVEGGLGREEEAARAAWSEVALACDKALKTPHLPPVERDELTCLRRASCRLADQPSQTLHALPPEPQTG